MLYTRLPTAFHGAFHPNSYQSETFELATSIAVLQTQILVAPDSPLHDGSPPAIFPRTPTVSSGTMGRPLR